MLENGRHENQEIHRNGGFDTNLRGVFETDFIESLVLLHESYFGDKFKPNEFNGFFQGLQWLKNKDNYVLFKEAESGSDFLPKPVKDFRETLRLFINLKREMKHDEGSKLLEINVAYSSHNNKEKLTRDLENSTYGTWRRFKDNPDYKTPDALCAKMFRAYWTRLILRAEILKDAREPSGS